MYVQSAFSYYSYLLQHVHVYCTHQHHVVNYLHTVFLVCRFIRVVDKILAHQLSTSKHTKHIVSELLESRMCLLQVESIKTRGKTVNAICRVSNLKYESVHIDSKMLVFIRANPGKKEATDRSGSHAIFIWKQCTFPEVVNPEKWYVTNINQWA